MSEIAGEPATVRSAPAAPRDPAVEVNAGGARADHGATVQVLFREHHLELVRLAFVLVGDLSTAEDVVQDVFERLHRKWQALQDPSRGLAYARSSVVNGCRSVHRRTDVARRNSRLVAVLPTATAPDAESAIDNSSEIVAALRRLPRRQREVVVLRYYADLDVAEIAETLQLSSSAVRATLSRALARLAQVLGED